jgi:hypothetical protein
MLSKTYNVAPYIIDDFSNMPISITYSFDDRPQAPQTVEAFRFGSSFPAHKTLNFRNKLGGLNLLIHYGQNTYGLMKGLPSQISNYKIERGKL